MSYQDIIYIHSKGHLYRIMHFGIDEETLEPEVAYRRCDEAGMFMPGQIFHRSCAAFFDGRFMVFEEIDGPEEVENIFVNPDHPIPETIINPPRHPAPKHILGFDSRRHSEPVMDESQIRDMLAATDREMQTKGVPYQEPPPRK